MRQRQSLVTELAICTLLSRSLTLPVQSHPPNWAIGPIQLQFCALIDCNQELWPHEIFCQSHLARLPSNIKSCPLILFI